MDRKAFLANIIRLTTIEDAKDLIDFFDSIKEEIADFAVEDLRKVELESDKRIKRQNEKASVFKAEVEGLLEQLTESVTAAEAAAIWGVTSQKASAVLKRSTDLGYTEREQVKIKGQGKVFKYTVLTPAEEIEE